ncbi:MAG: sigma-54-dependent transcriptional regulator [bacterium]
MPKKILIVDDDQGIRYSLKRMLEEKGLEIVTARSGHEALTLLDQGSLPDCALIDIVMPGFSGLDLLERIKEKNPHLMVIMITAHGTTDRAIRAMKLGAYDYILKPFDIPLMWDTVQKALKAAESITTIVSYPLSQESVNNRDAQTIVGDSLKMQEVYKAIGQIAEKNVTVLISGESGTGKELVARAIYHHSRRNKKPFLSINCAAIPENLLESELFGHEKGAFTSAEHERIGRFEYADGGTIFLDEIGDMPPHVQAKILRVIQEGEIQRLGSHETISVDVRLLAATNKDIEAGVQEGWFRKDLYYRLNVLPIHLPPLRERKEDIPKLCRYFIARFANELQVQITGINPQAIERLMHYHWPGNVRELENMIKRAMVICRGNEIGPEHFPVEIKNAEVWENAEEAALSEDIEPLLDQLFEKLTTTPGSMPNLNIISMLEKGIIERAIRKTSGNKVHAASLLGINRNTLRNKMERYGIKGIE